MARINKQEVCVHPIYTGIYQQHKGCDNEVDYYTAKILSNSGYYPFGVQMSERSYNSTGRRYGFNGKENDEETETMDFGVSLFDGDLGVWLSIDPKAGNHPSSSPYNFTKNNPVSLVDPDGKDTMRINTKTIGTLKVEYTTVDEKGKEHKQYSIYIIKKVTFTQIKMGVEKDVSDQVNGGNSVYAVQPKDVNHDKNKLQYKTYNIVFKEIPGYEGQVWNKNSIKIDEASGGDIFMHLAQLWAQSKGCWLVTDEIFNPDLQAKSVGGFIHSIPKKNNSTNIMNSIRELHIINYLKNVQRVLNSDFS